MTSLTFHIDCTQRRFLIESSLLLQWSGSFESPMLPSLSTEVKQRYPRVKQNPVAQTVFVLYVYERNHAFNSIFFR